MKTVMVDDSKIVSDMLMTICARIGQLCHQPLVPQPELFWPKDVCSLAPQRATLLPVFDSFLNVCVNCRAKLKVSAVTGLFRRHHQL